MTPEGKVKASVKKLLIKAGAYYVMPVTGGYGNSGAPDFIICHKGRFIGVECKAGKNKPTALQLSNMMHIAESGGKALVINEESIHLLEELLAM